MSPKKVWLTPGEASEAISNRAGYKITPDDLKQLRHRGKIKRIKKLNGRITLYHADEIGTVTPPKKRSPEPVSSEVEKDNEIGTQTP